MADPIATFTGLSGGFDYRSLITSILQAERAPAAALESQQGTLSSAKAAWGTYSSLMADVGTAAKALRTGAGFGAMTTTVVGTATTGRPILSATAAATGAQPGNISVQVTALASTGTGTTAVQPDATSPILAGGATTASFTINGVAITIDSTNNSLTGLRDAINAATGAKASAYLVQTGTGAALVVKANASGANGLNLVETSGTGTLAALGYTQQAGTDAALVVDGVAVTRSSNTVGDVVPGVTLNLTTAEPGTTVTVSVAADAKAASDAAQAFVTAYNKLVDFTATQVPVANSTTRPPLASEPSLNAGRAGIVSALQTQLATNPTTMQSLSQAGISLGRDGKLTFNAGTFATAYGTSRDDLKALFTDRMTDINAQTDAISAGVIGTVAQKTASIDRRVALLGKQVDAIDARLAIRKDTLTKQFVAMDAALSQLKTQSAALSSFLGTASSGA